MSILRSTLVGLVAAGALFIGTPAHAFVGCNNNGDQQNGEDCDNGPSIIADGCDDNCLVLAGWACTDPGGSSPSACHQIICGDDTTDVGEDCDGEECCDEECNFLPSTTECRAVAGSCDIAEFCTGSDAACPTDDVKDNSFVCRPSVNDACDVLETCTGVAECPPDELAPSCDDGDCMACTVSACQPDGTCVHSDTCVENCFSAGFYQNHASTEKDGNNITQAILDAAGGIFVCGHLVTATDQLEAGMSSAEEGLCIRVQGEPIRQLFRQELTAGLNCAISEGQSCNQGQSDCDVITSRFIDVSYDACDRVCQGLAENGDPTIQECIDALGCFNKGGTYENGVCTIGTCDDDGVTECEDDEDCDSGDCVRSADSCKTGSLCTEDQTDTDAEICFEKKGPASSPKICNVARHDECTADDNYCWQSCHDEVVCAEACNASPGCDPAIACTDAGACFNACFAFPFPGTYDCGCEYYWQIYCDDVTNNQGDYEECLYFYPVYEGLGFCQECVPDVQSCEN